jgi:CheY-like chemotaxis protein
MPPHRPTRPILPSTQAATNVIVVDDDPDIVASLAALLGEQGFAVEGFTDPGCALDRLRRGPAPDLVLSDCLMPQLTGTELVEALALAGLDTPVVLMTALADPGFFVDTGRVRVLGKPFAIEDLLAEIDAATRPASARRSVRPSG